jgi:hypothetical protein
MWKCTDNPCRRPLTVREEEYRQSFRNNTGRFYDRVPVSMWKNMGSPRGRAKTIYVEEHRQSM